MSVIAIDDLHYSVKPHFWSERRAVLRGVTLSVEAGELYGFLGPNGAGKTTTIKALLGLVRAERGSARLFGKSASDPLVRRALGFMPERPYFPEHLSGRELLLLHGVMAGLALRAARRRSDEVLEQVSLRAAADERLRTYSKGMLQRIGLAQALIGDPAVVVLDEPMSGLDPLGRRDVRELMLELRRQGKTVFFSTHILPDIESICDRVAILVGGRVQRVARLADLFAPGAARVEIEVEGAGTDTLAALDSEIERATARGERTLLTAPSLVAANRALDVLRAKGATVVSVQPQRQSLEQIFVEEFARGAARDTTSGPASAQEAP